MPPSPGSPSSCSSSVSSRSRPSRGARRPCRLRPRRSSARSEATRHAVTGRALPFSGMSPCSSRTKACATPKAASGPSRVCPGGAAAWRRAAVLTTSPVTRQPDGPRVTTTSPVSTPSRTRTVPGSRPRLRSRRTVSSEMARAARTARTGSVSSARPAPKIAMTASPMNFSTSPPAAVTAPAARANQLSWMCATSSASSRSDSAVKSTRSANTTLTTRRSAAPMTAERYPAVPRRPRLAGIGGRLRSPVRKRPPDDGHAVE